MTGQVTLSAKALDARSLDFVIHLLGDGKNRTVVQLDIDEAGLGDRIILHGNVHDVEAWLWSSDVYLHMAWYEPFGLVFLEAMTAGFPFVTLDGKGNRDLIEEGRNGHLVETENPGLFADGIAVLSGAPDLYGRELQYAVEHARAYNIGAATDELLPFYRSWVEKLV